MTGVADSFRFQREVAVAGAGRGSPSEIQTLASSGHGVLFTTHDPNHAMRAAHRTYLLRAGQRLGEDATGQILNRAQLEALYEAPVEQISDRDSGRIAFLPG